jgi:hypothetical protein
MADEFQTMMGVLRHAPIDFGFGWGAAFGGDCADRSSQSADAGWWARGCGFN